ncbi:MAG: hypothetical protein COA67_03600 [Lutibacter sp.]|nr:MAG: hypothetical protein COA67_03600 [Lutibacter sp.]
MATKLPNLKNFSLKNFLLYMIFIVSISSYSQTTNKRISIPNPTEKTLKLMHEAGIDLKCGVQFDENNNMILELAPGEWSSLDNKQISYTVLIEDLSKYYKERSEEFLPIAKKELEELKKKSLENKEKSQNEASKSLSFNSVTIDNIIQYDGCEEIDWSANVPQNFELGSMAGCFTYSEMLAQLDKMRLLYPSLITVKTDASPGTVTHGNSYNNNGQDTWAGQPIYYVKISDNPDTDESEPEALYTGMTHSREVSSMMNLMYFMWYILENYDTDSGVKSLVDNRELYFIPVANPDGLMWNEQQSPSGGGLQRKNLNPSANTGNNVLRGVDLNRNYDYLWGPNAIYGGSSGSTTSNVYRGTSGFSEPETQIIRDFAEDRDFKTALNHHASSNLLPHGYNGYPAAAPSGREDQYAKFCHDLTRYNRYIYGAAPDILTIANGDMSDWMFGGASDVNGSQGYLDTTGATEGILALAPENGSWQDSNEGFWPSSLKITEIAQRAVRMNYVSGLYAGKFAQLHDFTPMDINSLTGDLDFAIEFTGQTLGDFTIAVTPVSGNITLGPAVTETGMTKLEQRNVSISYTLTGSPSANDLIEYQVTLSNEDHIIYQANVVKYYLPTVVFQDNPDATGISNWTTSGSNWVTTADGFEGTTGLTHATGSYGNNQNRTITLDQTFNFTTAEVAIVQFNAKWALERNFDYVQLEARVNGGAWNELCGKYTKPGSDIGGNRYSSSNSADGGATKTTADQNNQPTGEMVYEGHGMDKWVMEEIYINAVNNSQIYNQNNVEFRFVFDSDSNNRADGYDENFDPFDGFTFDDFKVITLNSNIAQAIKFDPLDDKTIASPSFPVSATASSGLPVSFSIVSGPATIAGNTITLNGVTGTVTVQASQAGNSNYAPAANVTQSFEVTEVICTGNATITTTLYPYNEDFQSGFGDWVQASGDNGNWSLNSGGTVSGDTGPDNDADNVALGNYMYVEASTPANGGIGSNATTNLETPCFDLSGMTDADFSFAYHMFGSDMGQLFLEITEDNGDSWTDITPSPLSGSQHAGEATAWSTMNVELQSYVEKTIKMRFRGVTGGDFRSDIAIDNISMITVEEVLNTNEVEFDDFQIYPNPFDNNLKIRLPLNLTYNKLRVSVVDLQGRTLKEKIVTNNTQEINLDNLKGISNAVYFISIEIDGNVRVIKKLIKI